ncbi:MAG: EamA family transporter [Archangium sp.]|nr:EamA family transporter [Archangium sp.]
MGVELALSSAVAFGATVPLLGWAGAGVAPLTTAALLFGAALSAFVQVPLVRVAGAPLTKRELPALVLMALSGAAMAPTALAWGLQRTGPVTGSLLLNLKAVWSVVLAVLVFREHLGRRVFLALALMTLGGVALSLTASGSATFSGAGVAAVVLATVGWAIASRRLSEVRPLLVVAVKGGLGALLTAALAAAWKAPPEGWRAAALLAAGATGHGLSLRIDLLAQRRIGAARTASVFSLAPSIGAGLGLVLEPGRLSWGVAFAAGVSVHASEGHEHSHRHPAMEHDHAHRHDDGHHTHVHAEPIVGQHAHPHSHEAFEHVHAHGEDVHHAAPPSTNEPTSSPAIIVSSSEEVVLTTSRATSARRVITTRRHQRSLPQTRSRAAKDDSRPTHRPSSDRP